MKAIKKVFPNSTNYMCSWHLQQNLKKRFAYLNRGNDLDKKALYKSIINLPYQNYQKNLKIAMKKFQFQITSTKN